jgi:hypothetical protein
VVEQKITREIRSIGIALVQVRTFAGGILVVADIIKQLIGTAPGIPKGHFRNEFDIIERVNVPLEIHGSSVAVGTAKGVGQLVVEELRVLEEIL